MTTTGERLAYLSSIATGTAMEHLINIHTGTGNAPTITALDIVNTSGIGIDDGKITISAMAGTPPYEYSIGGAYQVSNVFLNLAENTYTVSVRDFSGYTDSISGIKLSAPSATSPIITELITIDASSISTFDGSIQVIVDGGTLPYQYALNDGTYQSANIFMNLHAGSYSVSVKDANNVVNKLSGIKVGGAKVVVSKPTGGFGIGGGVNRYRPSIRVNNVKIKDIDNEVKENITVKITI